MTCDELKAAINSEIAQNARIAAIRSRMDAGTADFLDSELYTAITAEITAEQMRRNVLSLSDREPAFVDVVRERYTDTFSVFNAVQRILDALTGIRIRTVQPEFENDRAHKIGHSLNDPTVPDSVIERRAYSATENFVRSQHDRCTKANASFRSRAGLDCRITRTGGAKCCDWCASVSGSFTTGNAPDGIWGRHDNCKCSITYETRRGSFQQLSGSGKGWDTVEELPDLPLHVLAGETAGAGDVHAVSAEKAYAIYENHLIQHQNYMITEKKDKNALSVNRELVNSKAYHDKFENLTRRKLANESLYQQAKRLLEARDGSEGEGLIIIDSRTGRLITDNLSRTAQKLKTGLTKEEYQLVKENSGNVIMLHNHPDGSKPSGMDILTLWREPKADATVIVGHDGAVYIISEIDRSVPLDKIYEKVYNDIVAEGKPKDYAKIKAGESLYELGAFSFIKR